MFNSYAVNSFFDAGREHSSTCERTSCEDLKDSHRTGIRQANIRIDRRKAAWDEDASKTATGENSIIYQIYRSLGDKAKTPEIFRGAAS